MTMSDSDLNNDGLVSLDYDSRGYITTTATTSAAPTTTTWPVAVDHEHASHHADMRQSLSHLQTSGHGFESIPTTHEQHHHHHVHAASAAMMAPDWHFQQHIQSHIHYPHQVTSTEPQYTSSYSLHHLQPSPIDFIPATEAHLDPGLLDGSYLPLSAPVDMVPFNYQDFHTDLTPLPRIDGLPDMPYQPQNLPDTSSPTDTYLEVRSLNSSGSDNGWSVIETQRPFDSFPEHSNVFINPSQTLHNRSLSESSYSDLEQYNPRHSFGGYVDRSHPLNSPTSDLELGFNRRVSCDLVSHTSSSPTAVSPVALVRPMPVKKKSTSPSRSLRSQASSSGSPPTRKPSRKSPIAAKTAETRVRKQSQSKSDQPTEKRIGKRKGPLNPDQRKQASEIRKLRACLRCKFLKKTVSRSATNPRELFLISLCSAIRASLALDASHPMRDFGKCHALVSTSRRLAIL